MPFLWLLSPVSWPHNPPARAWFLAHCFYSTCSSRVTPAVLLASAVTHVWWCLKYWTLYIFTWIYHGQLKYNEFKMEIVIFPQIYSFFCIYCHGRWYHLVTQHKAGREKRWKLYFFLICIGGRASSPSRRRADVYSIEEKFKALDIN